MVLYLAIWAPHEVARDISVWNLCKIWLRLMIIRPELENMAYFSHIIKSYVCSGYLIIIPDSISTSTTLCTPVDKCPYDIVSL